MNLQQGICWNRRTEKERTKSWNEKHDWGWTQRMTPFDVCSFTFPRFCRGIQKNLSLRDKNFIKIHFGFAFTSHTKAPRDSTAVTHSGDKIFQLIFLLHALVSSGSARQLWLNSQQIIQRKISIARSLFSAAVNSKWINWIDDGSAVPRRLRWKFYFPSNVLKGFRRPTGTLAAIIDTPTRRSEFKPEQLYRRSRKVLDWHLQSH